MSLMENTNIQLYEKSYLEQLQDYNCLEIITCSNDSLCHHFTHSEIGLAGWSGRFPQHHNKSMECFPCTFEHAFM